MDLNTFPNASYKAITVGNTDLRVLPTPRPHFNGLKDASRTYPFDNLQNSALHANTPLFVSHVAVDKSWVFVESGTGHGWIPARDVARVDTDFIQTWEHSGQVAVLRDQTPVYLRDAGLRLQGGPWNSIPGKS